MASENEMKIILEMIDKASPEFKKANTAVINEVKKLESETVKATNNMDDGFKKASQELRNFRTQIIPIVAILGTITVATKEWAKTNENTSRAFNDINSASKALASNIGSLLAPSIVGLSQVIKQSTESLTKFFDGVREAYAELFENITFATQYSVAFFTSLKAGTNILDAHKDATQIATQAKKEMGEQFRETMTEISFGNQLLMQSEQELDDYRRVLSDEDTLRKRIKIDEEMALLKFAEQNYRIAYANIDSFILNTSKSMQTNLSGAITNVVTGVSTAKEAFSAFGKAMVQSIVQYMAQRLVAFVLDKTLLAGQVAASSAAIATTTAQGVAQGAALTAAYAPAALAANIASFGGAAVAAAGTFPAAAASLAASLATAAAATTASNGAGVLTGLSAGISGGNIQGQGGSSNSRGSVEVENFLPQAEGGEYLVTKPTLFMAGEAGIERATFQPLSGNRVNGGGGFGDINIYIQGGIRSDGLSVEDMAEKLGFEFERQVRVAR